MKLRRLSILVLILNCLFSCVSAGNPQLNQLDRPTSVSRSPLNNQRSQQQMEIMTSLTTAARDRSRSPNVTRLRVLLPLYIYPNWYDKDKYLWKQVIKAAAKVQIFAIINPSNGPDHAPPNSDYQQGIKDLHQAGIKVIGYVPSNYGKRDLQAIKNDVDLYLKYFNVDGIFIDEATSTKDKFSYYQQLYQYIKSSQQKVLGVIVPRTVIINPGVDVDPIYLSQPVADVTVTFENYQKIWKNYQPPAYTNHYSAQHFAALVHTTANSKLMKSSLDRAVKHNFGYIYITSDSTEPPGSNPWDSLPDYWHSEVDYIQQLNANQ
jgi:Spherulation-specific family 4